MEQDNIISFILSVCYTKVSLNIQHHFQYVKKLKMKPILSPKSKDFNDVFSYYEIEIDDIQVNFDKSYKKIEDFHRRINYRYDWIKICINNENGYVEEILNIDEMRHSWFELKNKIRKDYVGEEADEYLNEIDIQFSSDMFFMSIFKQYFNFALLFPGISRKHSPDWSSKRNVIIQNNNNIMFNENISFVERKNHLRRYRIEGSLINSPSITLKKYNGNIWYSELDYNVENVCLEILYDNISSNKWLFTLERI